MAFYAGRQSYHSKQSHQLLELGQHLGPEESQRKSCNQNVNRIGELIKKYFRLVKIDRMSVSGSYGRKTALNARFDVDLVIFCNFTSLEEYKRMRPKIVDEFHAILSMEDDIKVKDLVEDDDKKACVTCIVEEVEFDILPAINLGQTYSVQYNRAREIIQSKQNKIEQKKAHDFLSTSLCESVSKFVADKDAFAHSMARLCKFWVLMTWPDDIKFSGKSSAIEFLALRSAELCPKPQNMVSAYETFLTWLQDIDSIGVYWDTYYEKSDIPWWNLKKPFLIDPCDPFNNRLNKFKKDYMLKQRIENAARESHQHLMHWLQTSGDDVAWACSALLFPTCCPSKIDVLHPSITPIMDKIFGNIDNWDVEFCHERECYSQKQNQIKVVRHRSFESRVGNVVEEMVELIMKYLTSLLRAESKVFGNSVEPEVFHIGNGVITTLEVASRQKRGVMTGIASQSNVRENSFMTTQPTVTMTSQMNSISNVRYNAEWDTTFHIPSGNSMVTIVNVRYRSRHGFY